MINSIYQIFNKGSLRTLSFILAVLLTLFFFLNINHFSTNLRSEPVLLVLIIIWGTGVLWIHGIGFEIRNTFWKALFLPLIGYIGFILAIVVSWVE
ncbi:cyd operon protein YbgE [Pasteurella multocida]|uniref:cyd operon protein YbgE n=1 Tax=Pasteurella multocida TaxID=747 RepID=UPI0024498B7F|nr:cyd operon protein YbgE [Pasteurella multocida]MDH3001812.1 cytochrome bd biosynthesis protein [Pasteurella multocida]